MSKGCYLDEWFEIECNNSVYGPPRAFISKIKMELLNISVRGWAIVKGPIISSNCYGSKADQPVNLTGSPFSISPANIFTAIGCNTRALMTDNPLQRLGDIDSGNQSADGCKLAFLEGTYGMNSWKKKNPNIQFPMLLDWMVNSSLREDYNNRMFDSSGRKGVDSKTLDCYNSSYSSSINEE
ncbi:hypothetical protein GH714_028114 [Hevea brasiliensis]|uniref:Wall-associated receptor kinase galacturonan-binding domain-containing protein n=1 Tax=Hevea brasiliensis TaxID=3981 RepID=A0A6A6LNA0_HEVBR|nr:hypothetical protein GH714_028114 [Hevea brasiliensis]